MKIAILGAGAFGTALGGILGGKGYDIDFYDSRVERERLSDVVDDAKYIILCVPSKAAPFVLPYLPKHKPLIVATKGILSAHVFDEFDDYMVLSGPGFADDIKARKKTVLTATDARVIELFETDYLSFDYTKDKTGVLMCGALKHVYALQAGLLGLERDTKEWNEYIDKVCQEMKLVLEFNSAAPSTVDLVCGIGDLKLTCGYPSRNYEFGDKKRVNPDYRAEKTVEGISAVKRIVRNDIKVPKDAVILKEIVEGFKDAS